MLLVLSAKGEGKMKVLGIETSCDETSVAVVEDGRTILSNIVATQIPFHKEYSGVVPEIASRKHVEWILPVAKKALSAASLAPSDIDAVAATNRPGLVGGLLVGLNFAKSFAYSLGKPFFAVNHINAHLYAPNLVFKEQDTQQQKCTEYPFLGLLVSGGHTIICIVRDFDDICVLGSTLDDSIGEAFDKVAKFYGLGYPGGVVIDRLAKEGDLSAAHFPLPKFSESHRYDVSYSGLKTAVIHQREHFWKPSAAFTMQNLCAAFQDAACRILVEKVRLAIHDTGMRRLVAGGGVAANTHLRALVKEALGEETECIFPPLKLCGDNGAMVAGVAFKYFERGDTSPLDTPAIARVREFKRGLSVSSAKTCLRKC